MLDGITMGLFLSMCISNTGITNKPQAIKVYQGETKPKYKIVDEEVINNVIVYK